MQMGSFTNVSTTPELIANPEMRLSQPISSHIQDFHVMVPSVDALGSVNIGTTQLLGKRKSPLHPSLQNKRMVLPMPPLQSSSVSPRTQFLPASFVSKNTSVSCNKSAARKQTSQKPVALRPQNESSGSVRSKMRESLVGALAMVQCQIEASKESKMLRSETATNTSEPVSAASGVNVMESNGNSASVPSPVGGISAQTVLPEVLISDIKEETQAVKPFEQDNVSYSDNLFSKDDLLQGNDLSWALESNIEFTENCLEAMTNDGSQEKLLLDPKVLAFEIETELFKLFGGVNKKYKEKGRSLLFNLKDKSNPKLREKVMYGDIPAQRLCSMSAEELASKELTEWRQAKAEEMAQMVVLQDTEVDIRSLVRKTHKGEFQVEVEPMDSGSVEVFVGMSSLDWSRPKNIKKKTFSITRTHGIKKDLNGSDKDTGQMNGVTIDDEMQAATGSLPPIVSLDEFMSSIDSESPSESSSSDTEKRPSVADNNDADAVLVCTSPKESADVDLGTSPVKAEDGDIVSPKPNSDLKSEITSVSIPAGECIWEGALQLSASSVSSVIGILRSGEKTTTKAWPMLLEIKGRVRLDAFEKFVRELPNSRSRAVMVLCFVCKDKCSKLEQENISEVVDSYVKDERVGYAEPTSGVELYLCPTRGRTAEILNKIVPRNQLDFLKSLDDDDGLIGLVVWRRPQFKKPSLSNNSHRERTSSLTTKLNTSRYSNMLLQVNHDDGGDDVPPGFGPMTMARDDEDDLPEFNYFSGGDVIMNRTSRSDSVRELIQKYGKSKPESFNEDDDNDLLPEWQPQPNPTLGLSHVNGGSMVRPCNEWWPHQAARGGY